MLALKLSISLTGVKNKKETVGAASLLVVQIVSLCTPLDCESIVMLSTCKVGMSLSQQEALM